MSCIGFAVSLMHNFCLKQEDDICLWKKEGGDRTKLRKDFLNVIHWIYSPAIVKKDKKKQDKLGKDWTNNEIEM